MSYSFTILAATKSLALAAVASKLDEVVAQQPSHEVDRAQAQQAAELFVGLLPDDAERDVRVSMNGSVGGTWSSDNRVAALSSVAVGVGAYLVQREPQA